jgi:hypothetical protein
MARRAVRDGEVVLALHERGEARDLLVAREKAAGIVAGVAAEVVCRDSDATVADRRRTQEIDSESPKMGEAFGRDALDRPADQRGRRPGVLVVRMPRPTGESARAKHVLTDFAVGCVQ